MVMQVLPYACATYPYKEDDLDILNLNLLELNDLPDPIDQVEKEAQQELAEIEAEAQRKRAIVENRRRARITKVNLIREHRIFSQEGTYKHVYLPAEQFIALVERRVSIINFIKDLEVSGPALNAAFTVIKVVGVTAVYAYVFPPLTARCSQLITTYLHRFPVMQSLLHKGLSVVKLPYNLAKWAWDPTKYSVRCYEIDQDGCRGEPLFNDDGTPKMTEVSRREETKFWGVFIGFAVAAAFGPEAITSLREKINELRAAHLLNQDWARTFFSTYFEWKVRKLKDIESQYGVPNELQDDPVLNQPKYRCAQSGQFLIIPMKTPSNNIFQYSVIEDWLLSHHTCPITEPEQNLQADQLSFDATTYNEIRHRLQTAKTLPTN